MPKNNMLTVERRPAAADGNGSGVQDFAEALWAREGELLGELVRALRTIRYGSIILTIHDGRIVEIHKTERIRRNGNKGNSASANYEQKSHSSP
jgi:hypothetical protein